jgi:hypothetical protein
LEVETATAKLKKYKSPGSDQIPAELIQAGGETLQSEIHKLINDDIFCIVATCFITHTNIQPAADSDALEAWPSTAVQPRM